MIVQEGEVGPKEMGALIAKVEEQVPNFDEEQQLDLLYLRYDLQKRVFTKLQSELRSMLKSKEVIDINKADAVKGKVVAQFQNLEESHKKHLSKLCGQLTSKVHKQHG